MDWETIQQALALLDDKSGDSAYRRSGEDEDSFVGRVTAVRRKVQERLRSGQKTGGGDQ